MEAVVMRTPKKNNTTRGSSFRSSENTAPANMYAGLFPIPQPTLSFSYPPSANSLLNNNNYNNLSHPYHHQQHPPLLPLPTPIARSSSSLSSRSSSTTRKTNKKARDQSVTPKKPKSKSLNPKSEEPKKEAKSESESLVVVSSTNRLGPEPNDLPKDVVPKVIVSPTINCVVVEDLDKFSAGSVFSLAPHPSSLPLPRFSLMRPSKLSCNAEAAGIDAGATDNLRRLLRLR